MKTIAALFICTLMTVSIALSQERAAERPSTAQSQQIMVTFKYKTGVQRIEVPETKSVIILKIGGRDMKIRSISIEKDGKVYDFNHVGPSTCFIDCPCGVDCWEDPILMQSICECKPCGGGGGGFGGTNGSLSYVAPC